MPGWLNSSKASENLTKKAQKVRYLTISKMEGVEFWRQGRESNPRLPGYEPSALPLGYPASGRKEGASQRMPADWLIYKEEKNEITVYSSQGELSRVSLCP